MTANDSSPLAEFDLNEDQERAALTDASNVLVLAGAGTGKTRTIVARIAHLIHTGTNPQRIVALTFTRASSNEMSSRVATLVGGRSQGLVATTFHGWSMRLIRSHPEVFGYEDWNVIDADDQISLMGIVRGRRAKGSFPTAKELVSAFSYSRNTATPLREAIASHLPEYQSKADEIVDAAKAYASHKQQRHLLDYDDILIILAATLEKRPDIADWVGQNFDHLLIDETQDTNPLQWRIIDQLVGRVSLFAVGDDAQSIYGFRGADFESIHSFSSRVPNTEIIRLEQNYRSTQEILDIANWLLAESPLAYNKRLHAVRGPGNKPEMRDFDDKFSEAAWIAEDIQREHDEGRPWREHLGLTRTNFGGRALEGALLAREIPYRYLGGTKLLESAHIKDVLTIPRVVENPRDDLAWMRLLTLFRGVGEVAATRAIDELLAGIESGKPLHAARKAAILPLTGPELLICMAEIETHRDDVAQAIDDAFAVLEPILARRYEKSHWDNRTRDFEPLKVLARTQPTITEFITEYLINPVYVSEMAGGALRDDAVTLATIHSAKGLEAERAYVIDVRPGSFPWTRAETEAEIEEERRVLYVALTRAKDYLHISRPWGFSFHAQRSGNSEETAYFLSDMPQNLVDYAVERTAPSHTAFAGAAAEAVDLGFDV